jgi:hypothetical protein
MASILKVDELQGITAAGDITVTSEGGAATQSLQQGLAKAWSHFDASGTLASRDSLNIASYTDNSTGNYNVNYSSNYANNDFAMASTSRSNQQFLGTYHGDNATSYARVFSIQHSDQANADTDTAMMIVNGDLA